MAGKEIHITLPDEALKQYQAFIVRQQQLRESESQIAAELDREIQERKSKYVTRNEIRKLKEGAVTYKSAGKAFIVSPPATVISNITKDLAASDLAIYKLKKVLVTLEGQEQVINADIQDLVRPFIPKQ